jgi:hypothetical protein
LVNKKLVAYRQKFPVKVEGEAIQSNFVQQRLGRGMVFPSCVGSDTQGASYHVIERSGEFHFKIRCHNPCFCAVKKNGHEHANKEPSFLHFRPDPFTRH